MSTNELIIRAGLLFIGVLIGIGMSVCMFVLFNMGRDGSDDNTFRPGDND